MVWIRILLLTVGCYHHIRGQNIVQFTCDFGDGAFWVTDANKCSNVPPRMSGHITALSANECVRLYDEINCYGASIEVLPHSPARADLRVWKFDNMAKSVGPCRNICDPEVLGAPLPSVNVQIYAGKNHAGANQILRVAGCTPVPSNFVNTMLSIKTFMYCIKLYNNFNCETDNTTGYDTRMIELRLGTPSHTDLSQWNFPQIRAISHCNYKCPTFIPTKAETFISNSSAIKSEQENDSNSDSKSNNSTASSSSTGILLVVILVQLIMIIGFAILFLWIKKMLQPSTTGYKVSWGKSTENCYGTDLGNSEADSTSINKFDRKNIL